MDMYNIIRQFFKVTDGAKLHETWNDAQNVRSEISFELTFLDEIMQAMGTKLDSIIFTKDRDKYGREFTKFNVRLSRESG